MTRLQDWAVGPFVRRLSSYARSSDATLAPASYYQNETYGVLLDPTYTAKAMAALIADVRSGELTPEEAIVFLHTGGTPALFAHAGLFD